MVLEAIAEQEWAIHHPVSLVLISFVVSSIGIWATHFVFQDTSSILSLAFVTIAFTPLIHSVFVEAEEEEAEDQGPALSFLARHGDLIRIYGWIFLGLIVSYAFWYATLPAEGSQLCLSGLCVEAPNRHLAFKEQEKTFNYITGNVVAATGETHGGSARDHCLNPNYKGLVECANFIFANNATVLSLSVAFSFLWGSGAVFLIGWNASVIGLFIGKEVVEKHLLAGLMRAVGYVPHGMPEVVAYFLGAIAGGMISAALSKKKFLPHEIRAVGKDVAVTLVAAYAILYAAALLEASFIVG